MTSDGYSVLSEHKVTSLGAPLSTTSQTNTRLNSTKLVMCAAVYMARNSKVKSKYWDVFDLR